MSHPHLKQTALITGGLVLSIPLAVVMEGLTAMNSPGFIIQDYLLPGHGLHDAGRVIVVGVALDSAFCFAVLTGLYLLFTRDLRPKNRTESNR